MGDEQKSKLRLEIAHVLFIDIVGYSKLRINEQSAQIDTLRDIVRGTEQFHAAEAEGKLLRLPTGDGGALAFRNSPEAPVLCAEEIAKALKSHPEIRVRMGIHSGPVNEVSDLDEQANIASAGINIAQRVMDCSDYFVGTQQVNQTYDQWHRDGLEFEVAGLFPGAVCQGTWKKIANDQVKLFHVAWSFAANGALNGYWDETQINTVDSNGNGYHGTFEMNFYDLNGKFLFKNMGTVKATRLSVHD